MAWLAADGALKIFTCFGALTWFLDGTTPAIKRTIKSQDNEHNSELEFIAYRVRAIEIEQDDLGTPKRDDRTTL